jgi:hypothetical protein
MSGRKTKAEKEEKEPPKTRTTRRSAVIEELPPPPASKPRKSKTEKVVDALVLDEIEMDMDPTCYGPACQSRSQYASVSNIAQLPHGKYKTEEYLEHAVASQNASVTFKKDPHPTPNMFQRRATVYVAAHGQIISKECSVGRIECIGDVALEILGRGGLNDFERYLRCVNYASSSHPGMTTIMNPTIWSRDDNPRVKPTVLTCASEPVNIVSLDICLKHHLGFNKTRLFLRDVCSDNPVDYVVDSEGHRTEIESMFGKKSKVASDSIKTLAIGANFWENRGLSLQTINKEYFLKPMSGENPEFECNYGIQIREVSGDPDFRIVEKIKLHDIYKTLPDNSRELCARELERYMKRHNIQDPRINRLIDLIYRERIPAKEPAMPAVTCSIAHLLLLYFLLGIDLDTYDGSCSVVMCTKGRTYKGIRSTPGNRNIIKLTEQAFPKMKGKIPSQFGAPQKATQEVEEPHLRGLHQDLFFRHPLTLHSDSTLMEISAVEREMPAVIIAPAVGMDMDDPYYVSDDSAEKKSSARSKKNSDTKKSNKRGGKVFRNISRSFLKLKKGLFKSIRKRPRR